MIPAEFDEIRPYLPEELPQIFEELIADPEFQAAIGYAFKGMPFENIAAAMRASKSNLEFQKALVYPCNKAPDGLPRENGRMIKRGTWENHKQKQETMRQLSYLAKVDENDLTPSSTKKFFTSQFIKDYNRCMLAREYWREQYRKQKESDVKVEPNVECYVFNPNTCKLEYVATMSVVSSRGIAVLNPDIKQGFNEYSNVSLATEFMEIVPIKRNFEANRQMFIMQNNLL